MTPPAEEVRVSVISVPLNALRWFYGLFSVGTVYLTVANTLAEAARTNAGGWQELQAIVTVQLAQAGGASVVGSAIIVEAGHMVIGEIIKQRRRRQAIEEGRAEGRLEGREENQVLWETWNRRRLEAEARGEAFNEPPPTRDNLNGTSG
jgi:hypothetical protein